MFIEYLYRPGHWMPDAPLRALSDELTALGRLCLDPLPDYQVFLGTREAFGDKVLTIARDPKTRQMVGFCSCVLLPIPLVGTALHLGLTCIHPALRHARLSNRLAVRMFAQYLLTRRPLGRLWVTSVACVLNVLGRVATNFPDVYPSPWQPRPFAPEVHVIAQAFDKHFRHVAYVQPGARFDPEAFVFRGSGYGTAFQKEAEATAFDHGDPAVNAFFRQRLRFEHGDEMLQVATLSTFGLLRYRLTRAKRIALDQTS